MAFLCRLGFHKYETIYIDTNFVTNFSDADFKIYHFCNFSKCKHCEKRKFITSFKKDHWATKYYIHLGLERAKIKGEQEGKPSISAELIKEYTKPTLVKFDKSR